MLRTTDRRPQKNSVSRRLNEFQGRKRNKIARRNGAWAEVRPTLYARTSTVLTATATLHQLWRVDKIEFRYVPILVVVGDLLYGDLIGRRRESRYRKSMPLRTTVSSRFRLSRVPDHNALTSTEQRRPLVRDHPRRTKPYMKNMHTTPTKPHKRASLPASTSAAISLRQDALCTAKAASGLPRRARFPTVERAVPSRSLHTIRRHPPPRRILVPGRPLDRSVRRRSRVACRPTRKAAHFHDKCVKSNRSTWLRVQIRHVSVKVNLFVSLSPHEGQRQRLG